MTTSNAERQAAFRERRAEVMDSRLKALSLAIRALDRISYESASEGTRRVADSTLQDLALVLGDEEYQRLVLAITT
jgi:hypothetical protein